MSANGENGSDSRTMIAEITKEKKYQSRAFLILPMSFNVAGILGPSKLNFYSTLLDQS